MEKKLLKLFLLMSIIILSVINCTVQEEFAEYNEFRAAGAKPVPISPKGVIYQWDVVFRWNPMTCATKYWLLVGDGPQVAYSNIVVDVGDIQGTTYTIPYNKFQSGKTYYWKVKGITTGTQGAWSSVVSFTRISPYVLTVNYYSANGVRKADTYRNLTPSKSVSISVPYIVTIRDGMHYVRAILEFHSWIKYGTAVLNPPNSNSTKVSNFGSDVILTANYRQIGP